MKSQIVDLLNNITNLNREIIQNKIEIPKNISMWDYAFPCFLLSKELKKSPNIIAKDLEKNIKEKKVSFLKEVKATWPYLNFFLSKEIYSDLFKNILNKELKNSNNKNKTIIIDYIWANVGKPLHIWHMCTPNLWQVIINIYKKLWYNVISDSHIGDWWIIFWKLIIAYLNWGDETKLKENAVEHLFQLYVKATTEEEKDSTWNDKFQQAFKELAEWRENYVQLWVLFTKGSIKSANKQLSKLNVKPDYNIWESFYEWLNLPKLEDYPDLIWSMKDIVEELIEKWIATKNEDGSVGIVFDKETKITSCILQKRNGTHGYLASDLAAVKYRIYNWKPEKIIYFVDVRQSLHFKQVFKTAELAWWLNWIDNEEWIVNNKSHAEFSSASQKLNLEKDPETSSGWQSSKSPKNLQISLMHAPSGFVKLKDGAMSTRKWRIIKLEALLDETEKRAKKIIVEKLIQKWEITQEQAEKIINWNLSSGNLLRKSSEISKLSSIIWVWAIKYEYLRKNRELDVIFDWDQFMTFEWNSAPYIMYSYVRWLSILEKNTIDFWIKINNYIFENQEEQELIKKLSEYKKVLEETIEKNYPHILANYTYELTKLFNNFYNNVQVLNEGNEDKKLSRLALIKKTTDTIKDSFDLLWIKLPEKM